MLNLETLQEFRKRYGQESAVQHLYILADHSGLPELCRTLRSLRIEWANIFGNDKRPELLQASPLLFELPANVQIGQWLEKCANFSHSILLIASPLELAPLAARLARRCDGLLSDGIGVTIRYFDTRVFPELLMVLTDEDREAWLSCATAWWFQARDGQVEIVESRFSDAEHISLPLLLSDEQTDALVKASEPDQVSDLLVQYTPIQFSEIPEQQRHGFVQHMIHRASSIGITAPRDYAIYSGLVLLKGVGFDRSPEWTRLREQIHSGKMTLSEAIEYLEREEA